MKVLKRHFNNMKLANKFALLFTAALLVISLTGIGILRFIIRKYDRELYVRTSMTMDYLVSDLESGLKEIATTTDYLLDNAQIQSALTLYSESDDVEERARSKRQIYDSLYPFFNSSQSIVSIVIRLPDNTSVRMGFSSQDFESAPFTELEKQSDEAGGRLIWQGGTRYHNAAVCARQIRQKAYLKLNKLATLFVEVDMEKLMQASGSVQGPAYLILQTPSDRIYFPQPFPSEMENSGYQSVSEYEVLRSGGNVYFITSGSLPYTGWRYVHFSDYEYLFSHIRTALQTAIAIFLFTTLLVLAIEYAVIGRLTSHFRVLVAKMKHFESGAPEPLPVSYDYSLRNDEIGILHRRFDQTVENYRRLVYENYRKQLLLKDASIRNLEQQIHPHFLYNVLDSIYLMAEAHGAPDIADMAHALASLFRASISGDTPTVSIRRELDHLDSYIQIQQIRFRDRIRFVRRCEESCLDILIPKLSIQPLVENAIKHGIEETGEVCEIVLSIRPEPAGTYISVANTGSSFEEDMERRLAQRRETSPDALSGHGIGLNNINERLELIYGPKCRLHFCNENAYAVVYFFIPKEGVENV